MEAESRGEGEVDEEVLVEKEVSYTPPIAITQRTETDHDKVIWSHHEPTDR